MTGATPRSSPIHRHQPMIIADIAAGRLASEQVTSTAPARTCAPRRRDGHRRNPPAGGGLYWRDHPGPRFAAAELAVGSRVIVDIVVVLVVWVAALVASGLLLGIVGFGLAGQFRRLRRAIQTAQGDVAPRTLDLLAQLPGQASTGRHRTERQMNPAD